MSKFQIILLAVLGFFILVGVATFSLYRGAQDTNTSIIIWGDIPARDFNILLTSRIMTNDRLANIQYVEKSVTSLENEFTEALARGTGPDLLILTQDQLEKNKPKLAQIPFG